jgi:molybdopterin synthase sulfur carrier subunit
MQIEVKLFANFQEFLPPGSQKYGLTMEVEPGTTVGQVLETLKISESIPMITIVNGIHRRTDEALEPGDVLSVFPPVAGG